MLKIKRKCKVSYTQFCSVFTSRTFTKKDKLTKVFYIVEDIEGNYRIEEHPTFIGYLFFTLLTLGLILPVFIVEGCRGVSSLKVEVVTLLTGAPLRCDDLHHNISSTAKLLELVGWW